MAGETGNRIDGNGPFTTGGLLTLKGDAAGVALRIYVGGRVHHLYPNVDLGMADRAATNIWHLRRPGEGGGGGRLHLNGALGGTGTLRLFSDPAVGMPSDFFYGHPGDALFDGDTHVVASCFFYYPSNITADATFRFGTRSGGEAAITLDRSVFAFAPVSHSPVAPTVNLANDFVIANTGVSTICRQRGRSTTEMAHPDVVYGGRLTLSGPLLLGGDSGSSPVANGDGAPFVPWQGGLFIDQRVAGRAILRQNRSGTTPVFTAPVADTAGPCRNPFMPGMDSNGPLVFAGAGATYRHGTVVGWCGNAYESGTWVTLQYGASHNAAVVGTAPGCFGTGDVVVTPGGRLHLDGHGILSADQAVTVQGHALALGNVVFRDDGTTGLPRITAGSAGVIGISGVSGAKFNALMASGPGRRVFLGAGMSDGTFTGASLAPGGDGVYRIGGGNCARKLTLDAPGLDGVLAGPHDVQVNAPVYHGSGLVHLLDTNSFTGALTVHGGLLDYRASALRGVAAAGGSSFGAAGGRVHLSGAGLVLSGNGDVAKGPLTFTGESSVELTGGGISQTFSFAGLARLDNGVLRLRDSNHDLGAAFRIVIDNPGPDLVPDSAGMVPPCYLHVGGDTIDFATHSAADGFAKAVYSGKTLDSAAAGDIVSQTAALALAGDARCHALRLSADLTAADADRTVTIGSGGLLLGAGIGAAAGANVNIDFGGREGVIYGMGGDRRLHGRLSNTGGEGLTLAGDTIRLSNPGNDFTGAITINSGQVWAQFDKDDGTAHGSLGPTGNVIRLNGGYLGVINVAGWRTLAAGRTLTLGPQGGGIIDDTWGDTTRLQCRIAGPGALYLSGAQTCVIDNPGNDWRGGTLVNSRNLATGGGCSPAGKMGQGPVVLMSFSYNGGCTFTFHGDDNLHYTAGPEKHLPVQVSDFSRAFFRSTAPVMGTLTGGGDVILGNKGVNDTTLTVGLDNADGTFHGSISQTGNTPGQGVGSLVKDGDGVFTLHGPHFHTGATTVNAGTLLLAGATTGDVVVNAGGTLGGSGRIGGDLTVHGGLAAELADDLVPLRVAGTVVIGGDARLDVAAAAKFVPGEREFAVLEADGGIGGLDNLAVSAGYAARVSGRSLLVFRRFDGTRLILR